MTELSINRTLQDNIDKLHFHGRYDVKIDLINISNILTYIIFLWKKILITVKKLWKSSLKINYDLKKRFICKKRLKIIFRRNICDIKFRLLFQRRMKRMCSLRNFVLDGYKNWRKNQQNLNPSYNKYTPHANATCLKKKLTSKKTKQNSIQLISIKTSKNYIENSVFIYCYDSNVPNVIKKKINILRTYTAVQKLEEYFYYDKNNLNANSFSRYLADNTGARRWPRNRRGSEWPLTIKRAHRIWFMIRFLS